MGATQRIVTATTGATLLGLVRHLDNIRLELWAALPAESFAGPDVVANVWVH